MSSKMFDQIAERCHEAGVSSKKVGRRAVEWSVDLWLMALPNAYAFVKAETHPIATFIVFTCTLYIIGLIVINTEVYKRLEEIERVTKEKEEFVIKANSVDDKDGENE